MLAVIEPTPAPVSRQKNPLDRLIDLLEQLRAGNRKSEVKSIQRRLQVLHSQMFPISLRAVEVEVEMKVRDLQNAFSLVQLAQDSTVITKWDANGGGRASGTSDPVAMLGMKNGTVSMKRNLVKLVKAYKALQIILDECAHMAAAPGRPRQVEVLHEEAEEAMPADLLEYLSAFDAIERGPFPEESDAEEAAFRAAYQAKNRRQA